MDGSRQFDTLLSNYINKLERRGKHFRTVKNATQAFHHCQLFLQEAGLRAEDADEEALEDFLCALKRRFEQCTAVLYFVQVRAAYKYAQRLGHVTSDPTTEIELPNRRPREVDVYSSLAELQRIEQHIESPREALIFFGLAYTGARRIGLRQLEW